MTAAAEKPPRYAWVMVAVTGTFLGLASGSILSISVFLKPLVAEFGWLRAEVSGGYIAATLSLGVGGIVMGWLADRFPVRRIVWVGVATLAAAFFLLARVSSTGEFYLYSCLLGGVGVAALFAPLIANLGAWFDTNRGLALGLATAAQALGQGFVPFLARLLISGFGWRGAYDAMAVAVLVVLFPLSLLVRPAPAVLAAAAARAAPKTPGQAKAAPETFVISPAILVTWLSVAVVFCCICMATPLVHVVALGQDKGFPGNVAASILVPIYVAGFFSRILFGRVADWIGGVRAYWVASAGQTAAVFWFVKMDSLTGFYTLGPLYGLFFAGVMTSFIVAINQMTPVEKRGISNGVVTLFGWLGMGLGGWQAGYFFDLTGNYTASFANAAFAGMVNLVIVGGLWLYISRRRAVLATAPAVA